MDLKLLAIYERYFNTGLIPGMSGFCIDIDIPLYSCKNILAILNNKPYITKKELSDFVKKYT